MNPRTFVCLFALIATLGSCEKRELDKEIDVIGDELHEILTSYVTLDGDGKKLPPEKWFQLVTTGEAIPNSKGIRDVLKVISFELRSYERESGQLLSDHQVPVASALFQLLQAHYQGFEEWKNVDNKLREGSLNAELLVKSLEEISARLAELE